MTTKDVLQAKLVTELGLSHDAGYQPEERHRIAVHEAGHALLAELCGRRVNVASILRRSDALGLVSHVDSEERHLFTPQQAMKLIHIALGGMVAEELEFGEASSGISSDLAAATTIAAQLVGSMGAGGSRLSLEAASVPGAANLVAKVLGDEASRAAAERIIDDAETAARELMTRAPRRPARDRNGIARAGRAQRRRGPCHRRRARCRRSPPLLRLRTERAAGRRGRGPPVRRSRYGFRPRRRRDRSPGRGHRRSDGN